MTRLTVKRLALVALLTLAAYWIIDDQLQIVSLQVRLNIAEADRNILMEEAKR